MNPNEKTEFAALLSGVFSLYRQTASDFVITVFWNACQRYDMDQVREAFNIHVMDPDAGQFVPKPADIVKHLQGTHGDRAQVAWGKAFGALQSVGQYNSVQFDDGVIHKVIEDLGGWVEFNKITFEELPYLQKRFCDAYRAQSRSREVTWPSYLCGLAEIANGPHGMSVKPPVLIGNPAGCARVAQLARSPEKQGPAALQFLIEGVAKRLPAPQEGGQA